MSPSNKLSQLLIFYSIVNSVVLALNLPNNLPDLLALVEQNLQDIYTYDPPLFLSPYIESGEIETGRSLSRVGQLPGLAPDLPSYSGYFTVNEEYNSNIFFWFFPALNKNPKAPVILWLQGGPGTSGLVGVFVEHGPYVLYSNRSSGPVGLREHTWTREFSVIFIDSPVGTGYSFADDEKGYPINEDQVVEDLYSFLKQFFQVYYEYASNDFYVFGESYGAKHCSYLGYKLHVDGPPANVNFKGISLGNPFIDVQSLANIGEYYYQLGIVDKNEAFVINSAIKKTLEDLQKGNYIQAVDEFNKFNAFFRNSTSTTVSYLENFTGYEFFFNYLQSERPEEYGYYVGYIQSPQARNAIHVGNLPYKSNKDLVYHSMRYDLLTSFTKSKLELLVDNYKLLVYSGQLDLIFPYVTTDSLLQSFVWRQSNQFRAAQRKIWRLGQELAGYVRSVGNLSLVLVRNAGHVAQKDQPEAVRTLITKFINDVPL